MTDLDDTEIPLLDYKTKWGTRPEGEAVLKLVRVVRRHEQELEQARQVIQNLRDRVKTLEDAP